MIVFTCINGAMVNPAIIWASTLQKVRKLTQTEIKPMIFHTPDVDISRFAEFDVQCVAVSHDIDNSTAFGMAETHGMTMRLRVLDLMQERGFDHVLYTDADVMFQHGLDELLQCPILSEKLWIAAREDYVYHDDKRLAKHYAIHDPMYHHRMTFNEHYFNSGVMLLSVKGLFRELKRRGYTRLMDMYTANHERFQFPDQDLLNDLCTEKINLFDRYNAFAELNLRLDFGDVLGRKHVIHDAAIVHFAGRLKPWTEHDMPTIVGAQYPLHNYLAACREVVTHLDFKWYRAVKENAEKYNYFNNWLYGPMQQLNALKQKLADFGEELDKQ